MEDTITRFWGAVDPICQPAFSKRSTYTHAQPVDGAIVSKIAFSSCYKPESVIDPDLWVHMRREFSPDVWSWLGDNSYTDGTNMETKRQGYLASKEQPFYVEYGPLAVPQIPVTGTWDDHDYASNNQGALYACPMESQNEFVYFMDLPSSDSRHPDQGDNQQKGVYSANMFSAPHGDDRRRNGIHLIHLDARSHRSPTFASHGPCLGAEKSTMLGPVQWAWFEAELQKPADVKIIGSGIQVLQPLYRGGDPREPEREDSAYCAHDGKGNTFDQAIESVGEGPQLQGTVYESWAEIPVERTRLLKLCQQAINDGFAKKIIFISGDQHWGEIMAKKMPGDDVFGPSVTLFEVTASGIDQNWPLDGANSNRLRVRSADRQGNGVFDQECNFPFVYHGTEYNDCTEVASDGGKWCAIVTEERRNEVESWWGYCLPEAEELVKRSSISYTDEHTCTDNYLHVCSAQANYGGIQVNWDDETITMSIFTPHAKGGAVAGSATIPLSG